MEGTGDREREEREKMLRAHAELEQNRERECVKERSSGRDREGWRNRAEGDEYTERQRAKKWEMIEKKKVTHVKE